MFCSRCGRELADAARFCPGCGVPVTGRRGEGPAPAPPVGSGGGTAGDGAGPVSSVSAPASQRVEGEGSASAPRPAPQPAAHAAPSSAPGAPADPGRTAEAPSAPVARSTGSRRVRPLPVAIAAVILAALALAGFTFLAPADLVGSIPVLGQVRGSVAQEVPLIGTQSVVSDGTYDYFYSLDHGGIVRAAVDGSSTELIYPIDTMTTNEGGMVSSFSGVMSLDDGHLFFLVSRFRSGSEAAGEGLDDDYEDLHRIATDGTGDTVVYRLDCGNYDGEPDYQYDVARWGAYGGSLYIVEETRFSGFEPGEYSYQLVRTDHGGGNREELALVTSSVDCVLFITPEKLYHATGAYAFGDAEVLNELYVQNLDGSEFRRVYTGNMGDVSLRAVRGDRLYLVEGGEADTRRVTSIAVDGSDAQILYEQGSSASITVSHFEGDEMVLVISEEGPWVTRFVAVGLSGSHEQRQLLEVGDDLSMPIWLDGRYSIRSSTSFGEADDVPDAMMMSPDGTITEYAR